MLIQILKNDYEIDVLNEVRIRKKFITLLIEVYGKNPNPLRISKLTINKDIYPFQIELLVDFVNKIGKVNVTSYFLIESIREC